tara:strand:+ start:205 stop:492 length:288 start_codon:yes stop_codon:yes gene_type:complete
MKTTKGVNMKITKEEMEKCVEIFDKHFPAEKNKPFKEKESVVQWFIDLNEFANKKNVKLGVEHFRDLQKVIKEQDEIANSKLFRKIKPYNTKGEK